jgi:hypothetical protein
LVIKALDPDWIQIRIGIQPKMLDPDPDEMNADPQPWSKGTGSRIRNSGKMSSTLSHLSSGGCCRGVYPS